MSGLMDHDWLKSLPGCFTEHKQAHVLKCGVCVYSDLILLACNGSLGDKLLSILLQNRLLLLDLLVHQRLGEHGLVHLVMAIPTVTHLDQSSVTSLHGWHTDFFPLRSSTDETLKKMISLHTS